MSKDKGGKNNVSLAELVLCNLLFPGLPLPVSSHQAWCSSALTADWDGCFQVFHQCRRPKTFHCPRQRGLCQHCGSPQTHSPSGTALGTAQQDTFLTPRLGFPSGIISEKGVGKGWAGLAQHCPRWQRCPGKVPVRAVFEVLWKWSSVTSSCTEGHKPETWCLACLNSQG